LNSGTETYSPSWVGVVLALTVFTGAAADTLSVVINRLRKGKSPMVGGKDHTTHHLVYSGKTDKQVWVIFFLIGLVGFLLACLILQLNERAQTSIIALLGTYFIFVFLFLYRYTIYFKEPVNNPKN
jgi:UDP-GlcNAc:undecaprenyl-phosphate GlcNAc-1-phosphate transferase